MFTYKYNIHALCKSIKYAVLTTAFVSTSFLYAAETKSPEEANTTEASHAAESAQSSGDSMQEQIDRGKEKSAACAACHGPSGVASIPDYPNLAAQVPGYIASQLALFKSGERENALMAGQAAPLSEEDMSDIDAYFSSLDAGGVSAIIDESDEAAIAQATLGQQLYRGGNNEFQIPACMSCHGPTAAGIPAQYPRLANQSVTYLENQLVAYKSGARTNDVMNSIAFELSEKQIKALASYIASIEDTRIQE